MTELTPGQSRIVREIKRIAAKLGTKSLSQRQFDEHHELGGVTTAGNQFGSWNEAVQAAGLEPISSTVGSSPRFTDDDLLSEIIRVHRDIGEEPSMRKMEAKGRISLKPYVDRWGTFSRAKGAAYERFGRPEDSDL